MPCSWYHCRLPHSQAASTHARTLSSKAAAPCWPHVLAHFAPVAPPHGRPCRRCRFPLQGHLAGGAAAARPKQLTFEIFFPRPGSGTPYRGAQYRAARGKVRAGGSAGTRRGQTGQICSALGLPDSACGTRRCANLAVSTTDSPHLSPAFVSADLPARTVAFGEPGLAPAFTAPPAMSASTGRAVQLCGAGAGPWRRHGAAHPALVRRQDRGGLTPPAARRCSVQRTVCAASADPCRGTQFGGSTGPIIVALLACRLAHRPHCAPPAVLCPRCATRRAT